MGEPGFSSTDRASVSSTKTSCRDRAKVINRGDFIWLARLLHGGLSLATR